MKLFKVFSTLVLLLLLSFSLTNAQDINSSLVAHYTFNGNLNDATGNYNAVDTVGGPVQYVTGYDGTPNGAINFPGDASWYKVDCGRFSPLQMGVKGQFSVTFWANWNGIPADGHTYQDIIDKRDTWNDTGMVFSIQQDARWPNWKLGLWRGGNPDNREYGSLDSLSEGHWDFWGITFDTTTGIATFYKNGAQYDQGIYIPAHGYNAMVCLGTSPSGQSNSFNGKLDEVSFYSRALTANEISGLYDSYTKTSTNTDTTLVAHYKFNGNLNDETGNYNAVDTVGGPVQYVQGFDGTPNGAINFPGDASWYKVDCGRFSPLQMGVKGEFSVAFWANWNGPPADGHTYQDIIDKRDTWNDTGMVFSIQQDARWPNWKLGLWRGGNPDNREYGSLDSLSEGHWDFWTITFDTTTGIATFYKNGAQYDQGIYIPAHGYNAMVCLGTSPSGQSNSFNGKLDEVSFYSRALTAQDVSDLYNSYSTTAVEQVGNSIPSKFELSQNYPNPFNPTTNIQVANSGIRQLLVKSIQYPRSGSCNIGRWSIKSGNT